jgi:hypothetical protein
LNVKIKQGEIPKKINPAKKYINSKGRGCGDETPKTINFCDKLSLSLSSFSEAPPMLLCTYIFTAPTWYYSSFTPRALNAEFQNFIPRFDKNFITFTLRMSLKEGLGGERRAQRQIEDKVTSRIISLIRFKIMDS